MKREKNLKKEIGKRIEFIRNQKEMTKESFAKLINISGQHLGKVITGQKGLSIEKIVEIAEKTEYSTEFILRGKINPEADNLKKKINYIKNNIESIDEILRKII
ncbi:MAG: helix-turn-helix transcriptional regulator [Clostridia bacterium]|jgi:transcriptional regulator with XRE-family HTH domain|nr:helix-turn-helix transcriptional regulator [Clostridia bacterium]